MSNLTTVPNGQWSGITPSCFDATFRRPYDEGDAIVIARAPLLSAIEPATRHPEFKLSWRYGDLGSQALPRKQFMTFREQRGFSMVEMLIVLCIVIILASVAFITMWPALNKEHVDTAYDTTLQTLRVYRNLAISQSRNYIVTFAPAAGAVPATITISWWQGGVPRPIPIVVNTVTLPPDVDYFVQGGIPTAANAVPDGFGVGAAAIDLDYTPAGGGGGATVVFMPDGSVQDQAGNPDSGVIYLSRTAPDLYSSRAITVWGTTGRIRGWRLDNQGGAATWVQQ